MKNRYLKQKKSIAFNEYNYFYLNLDKYSEWMLWKFFLKIDWRMKILTLNRKCHLVYRVNVGTKTLINIYALTWMTINHDEFSWKNKVFFCSVLVLEFSSEFKWASLVFLKHRIKIELFIFLYTWQDNLGNTFWIFSWMKMWLQKNENSNYVLLFTKLIESI